MQFPVLSRYFLLAAKVKVIAGLNDCPKLHQTFPCPVPNFTTTCLHLGTSTILFSRSSVRSRQAILLQWQLPPGTGPRAGIPKVTSWGKKQKNLGRWYPPPTNVYKLSNRNQRIRLSRCVSHSTEDGASAVNNIFPLKIAPERKPPCDSRQAARCWAIQSSSRKMQGPMVTSQWLYLQYPLSDSHKGAPHLPAWKHGRDVAWTVGFES